MKKVLIIVILLVMVTTNYAQGLTPEQTKEQQKYFTEKVTIPTGYSFKTAQRVKVDGLSAILFRYTKGINNKLNEEHFSFIVTENKPFKILGFTTMDTKYTDKKQLSKEDTEKNRTTIPKKH